MFLISDVGILGYNPFESRNEFARLFARVLALFLLKGQLCCLSCSHVHMDPNLSFFTFLPL